MKTGLRQFFSLLVGGLILHTGDIIAATPEGYGIYDEEYWLALNDPDPQYLFNSREFFADVFYGVADFRGSDVSQGAGIGIGYYFSRFFGWSIEGFGAGDGNNGTGVSTGALIRLPIDHAAMALYGMAGGGYLGGDSGEWNLQVGGGVDVRLLDRISTFFDARFIEPVGGESGAFLRVGVRILF